MAKGSLISKQGVIGDDHPVALFHDGPLARRARRNNNKHQDVDIFPPPMMNDEEVAEEDDDDDESLAAKKAARELVQQLQHATNIRQQLQALQTYRNKTLILRQQQQQQQQQQDVKKNPASAPVLLWLYRLLLEWKISVHVPTALRRAITSCLTVAAGGEDDDAVLVRNEICTAVLSSIVLTTGTTTTSSSSDPDEDEQDDGDWQDPLLSLQELLSWEPMQKSYFFCSTTTNPYGSSPAFSENSTVTMIAQILQFLLQHSRQTTTTTSTTTTDNDDYYERMEQRGVQIAKLVDTTLLLLGTTTTTTTQMHHHDYEDTLDQLRNYLLNLLSSNHLRESNLSIVAIAYGRTLQQQIIKSSTSTTTATTAMVLQSLDHHDELPDLQRAAILQGLTVVLTPITRAAATIIQPLMQKCQDLVTSSSDPGVRLLALKGMGTLLSRLLSNFEDIITSTDTDGNSSSMLLLRDLTNESLSTVLQAWENPSTRQLANAIPAVFATIVQLQMKLQTSENYGELLLLLSFPAVDDILRNVLQQLPENRRGRYLALEILLPVTGAAKLLSVASSTSTSSSSSSSTSSLLQDLLRGITVDGNNTGVIADLWAKLLQQLLQEMKQAVGIVVANNAPSPSSSLGKSKQKNKKKKKGKQQPSSVTEEEKESVVAVLLPEWIETWVPSLAHALTSLSEPSRRKQLSCFCLPRLSTIMVVSRYSELPQAFDALLQQVGRLEQESRQHQLEPISQERETVADRILWAKLEIVHFAAREGLLKQQPASSSSSCWTKQLRQSVKIQLPFDTLHSAVTHSSSTIRVVALQAMNSILSTYNDDDSASPFAIAQREIELWKYALPLMNKTESNEYITSVLFCLLTFLDRMFLAEATAKEVDSSEESLAVLPICRSFVVDYLINDIIIRQTGYPGTVACKEIFMLALLECIIVFVARDHPLASESKFNPKSSAMMRRRRLESEKAAVRDIQVALLSREVFASLFSLLHSNWDNARSGSYKVLISLIQVGHDFGHPLPKEFLQANARAGIESRGMFLVSSPRQRETDTGSRMLAFLYHSSSTVIEKTAFLAKLVDTLDHRLAAMEERLRTVLNDESDIIGGAGLPLAHGIIRALNLVIEGDDMLLNTSDEIAEYKLTPLLDRLTALFCRAIRISLAVVADVREGEMIDGMDGELNYSGNYSTKSSNKINPGCIGANGIFSSITRSSKEEHARRIASQRIVIGSWLLTKETCAAAAALLTRKGYNAGVQVYNTAGMLLISTLTSLKHTGAAFAAHRAIQRLALACFRDRSEQSLQQLPHQWASRLLNEVSEDELVRDSTLRRSGGYSLGFISLMRSEISSSIAARHLCRRVMVTLLKLSLPSHGQVLTFLSRIGLLQDNENLLFLFSSSEEQVELISDASYQQRTRVHALNALRLILLDAPLSKEIFPYAGFAIMSSVIGYTDSQWSVRNSSTMLFAATMLRSIDADKNASKKDSISSNAIALHELFRAYPPLPSFLLAVLKGGVSGVLGEQHGLSLPPILPILLLMARVQPVAQSGHDSVLQAEEFIPVILACLKHRYLSIRKGAARALTNLSSGERGSSTEISRILLPCQNSVSLVARSEFKGGRGDHWNALHGSLLLMRELVAHSKRASNIIRSAQMLEQLLRITRVCGDSILIPPPCLSVALEVLDLLIEDKDYSEFLTICQDVMMWLERDPSSKMNLIGGSDLGAVAASIATRRICSKLWSSDNTTADVRQVGLEQLSTFFLSRQKDARLASVKTFKKTVYSGIDGMVARGVSTCILYVAEVLLKAIQNEIDRDAQVHDHIGAHPPTLRRLSRCLVECMNATGMHRNFKDTFYNECRTVALKILKRGKALEKFEVEPESLTKLDGNAVELLSFVYAADTSCRKIFLNDLRLVITRLSGPSCHWRLRHSAAVAIQNSKILRGLGTLEIFSPESVQLDILRIWLVLMQDEDIDVRYVAARTIGGHPIDNLESCLSEPSADKLWGIIPSKLLVANLCSELLELTRDLGTRLEDITDEIKQSLKILSPSELMNVGTERNIFEEEDPNSYHEQCVIGQIAAMGIVAYMSDRNESSKENSAVESMDLLLSHSSAMLPSIQSRLQSSAEFGNTDIVHELTRNNTIFPVLHNLLIGSTALICWFRRNECDVDGARARLIQQAALEILSSYDADCASAARQLLHPCILEALKTLAFAKDDQTTVNSLRQCCFLLRPK